MICLSKIHEKDHQCLYPIHQQMICSIYDFVFHVSFFIECFHKILKLETLMNIQFDWKIINATSTQTIVNDRLQVIFFHIFVVVCTCDVVRVACLSKQVSECSFITLTGTFLLHIGQNTLQYFFLSILSCALKSGTPSNFGL